MSSAHTLSSRSTLTYDLTGDGIRSEADAKYRKSMLANITKAYENGWLK